MNGYQSVFRRAEVKLLLSADTPDFQSFVELKKKMDGVVYKRRADLHAVRLSRQLRKRPSAKRRSLKLR